MNIRILLNTIFLIDPTRLSDLKKELLELTPLLKNPGLSIAEKLTLINTCSLSSTSTISPLNQIIKKIHHFVYQIETNLEAEKLAAASLTLPSTKAVTFDVSEVIEKISAELPGNISIENLKLILKNLENIFNIYADFVNLLFSLQLSQGNNFLSHQLQSLATFIGPIKEILEAPLRKELEASNAELVRQYNNICDTHLMRLENEIIVYVKNNMDNATYSVNFLNRPLLDERRFEKPIEAIVHDYTQKNQTNNVIKDLANKDENFSIAVQKYISLKKIQSPLLDTNISSTEKINFYRLERDSELRVLSKRSDNIGITVIKFIACIFTLFIAYNALFKPTIEKEMVKQKLNESKLGFFY